MSRSRDGCEPILARNGDDDRAQPRQIRAHLRDGATDPGVHFELRAQELRTDLTATAFGTFPKQGGRRILVDVARIETDEKVFLLDTDREWRLCTHCWKLPRTRSLSGSCR